jgi:hypothetical protein
MKGENIAEVKRLRAERADLESKIEAVKKQITEL